MTKHAVDELFSGLLDAAVTKAMERLSRASRSTSREPKYCLMTRPDFLGFNCMKWMSRGSDPEDDAWVPYQPSTDWSVGGPLIEAMQITLQLGYDEEKDEQFWTARCGNRIKAKGPTPLIAAMRAFVRSEVGRSIELETEQALRAPKPGAGN